MNVATAQAVEEEQPIVEQPVETATSTGQVPGSITVTILPPGHSMPQLKMPDPAPAVLPCKPGAFSAAISRHRVSIADVLKLAAKVHNAGGYTHLPQRERRHKEEPGRVFNHLVGLDADILIEAVNIDSSIVHDQRQQILLLLEDVRRVSLFRKAELTGSSAG